MKIIIDVLLLWLMWGFIFAGLGAAIFCLVDRSVDCFDCFWVGWASSLFFLQIWHFFAPVDIRTVGVCFLISMAGWIGSRDWLKLGSMDSEGYVFVFLLFSGITAVWLALRLWSSLILYDHPLYYLQQIFWAKSFPVIPGLANLYNRLGFYDGFFLYTAMMDSVPLIPGYKQSVSLLMLVLLVRSIWGVVRVIKDSAAGGSRNIFFALLFVPVFMKAQTPCTVSVPVTDTAVFLLTIIVFGYFLDFLTCPAQNGKSAQYVFLITVLSTAGMIIKGSFFFVGGWVLIVTYGLWIFKCTPSWTERKTVITGIVIASAGVLAFMVRNVIVSGYVFYPFPYFSVPADWRVPFIKSYTTFNWVLSWSRMPKTDWHIVLKSSAWVSPWLRFMMRQRMAVVMPGIFFLLSSAVLIVRAQIKTWGVFSVVIGMCLLTWFLSAPDVRFVEGPLLVLAAGTTTILLSGLRLGPIFWKAGGMLVGVFIVMQVVLLGLTAFHTHFLSDSRHFYQFQKVALKLFKTDSGLVLTMPAQGEFCWDAPAFCTPYPDRRLTLRRAGDILGGFKIAGGNEGQHVY